MDCSGSVYIFRADTTQDCKSTAMTSVSAPSGPIETGCALRHAFPSNNLDHWLCMQHSLMFWKMRELGYKVWSQAYMAVKHKCGCNWFPEFLESAQFCRPMLRTSLVLDCSSIQKHKESLCTYLPLGQFPMPVSLLTDPRGPLYVMSVLGFEWTLAGRQSETPWLLWPKICLGSPASSFSKQWVTVQTKMFGTQTWSPACMGDKALPGLWLCTAPPAN